MSNIIFSNFTMGGVKETHMKKPITKITIMFFTGLSLIAPGCGVAPVKGGKLIL